MPNQFPFVTNNPSGFKLTDTQLSGNNSLGKPSVQSIPNVANPKSIGQPSANGYSQIPTNPKYTPFTNYSPKPANINVPQAVQTTATTVSGLSRIAPIVNRLGMIGTLLSIPSVASDVGGAFGYLFNLPQNISNAFEKDRLDKLIKQREARAADSARINNNGASRTPDAYKPRFKGGQSAGISYGIVFKLSNQSEYPSSVSFGNNFTSGYTTSGTAKSDNSASRTYGAIGSISYTVASQFSGNVAIQCKNTAGTPTTINVDVPFGAFGAFQTFEVIEVFRIDNQTDTGGDIPNPNPVVQPPYPAPPVHPSRDEFPYAPTVNVNDGFVPELAKKTWSDNSLKPFAEPPIAPASIPFASPKPSADNDKKIKKTPSGFPQIQVPTAPPKAPQNLVPPSLNKPSFTAKPYISGVSNPSEAYDPVDVTSGLTRSQQDEQWKAQNEKFQYDAKANERAAAVYDAKRIEEQLVNLSDVPKADLGGKSPQQFERERYQNSIKDNPDRVAAYKEVTGRDATIKNTTPNTPVSTGNNFLSNVVGLGAIAATVTALKIGSDVLVNNSLANTPKIDNINANTQPSAQQTNAKQGVCDAMQPNQCGFEGVKQATTVATNPIKEGVANNAGLLAQILAAIANLASTIANLFSNVVGKLDGIKEFLDRVWSNQLVDKAMQYVTMITVIHNAAMLSRSLLDTLGSALDSGLQIFGLQLKDKEGNQMGISAALGQSFQNLVKGIIGADNYTALNNTWLQANRIYQSGINLLSNVQSILDSTTAVAELTNNRLGTFMNAVRSAGGVRENAYGAQSENVTKFNSYLERMQNLEQGVSNLASITGNVVSVQQSVAELSTNRTEFENALKDKPQGTGLPENTPQKTADAQKKADSKWTIGDFSIVKPPEVP